jgi:hypothetical protein
MRPKIRCDGESWKVLQKFGNETVPNYDGNTSSSKRAGGPCHLQESIYLWQILTLRIDSVRTGGNMSETTETFEIHTYDASEALKKHM